MRLQTDETYNTPSRALRPLAFPSSPTDLTRPREPHSVLFGMPQLPLAAPADHRSSARGILCPASRFGGLPVTAGFLVFKQDTVNCPYA